MLLTVTAFADSEKKVTMHELPAAVQQAIAQQSKGATVRGLSREIENGKMTYEAELTVNNHGKDISFDAAGKIVGVEEEVPLASVPQGARAAIQKAVGAGKLQKVEAVTENGVTAYEATIVRPGKSSERAGKSSETTFSADGARAK
ncbi:MAG: PepSY-like domain-containing protein [Bryobacteraceae bacterium]